MGKTEFLAGLRKTLFGRIPESEIEKNIAYYSEYFDTSGKSESEVYEELGDPSIIARTIITAYKESKGDMAGIFEEQARQEYTSGGASSDYTGSENRYDNGYDNSEYSDPYGEDYGNKKAPLLFRLIFDRESVKWYELALAILIGVVVIGVVFAVIAIVFKFTVTVILPILIIFLLVGFIVALFNRE